MTDRITDLFIEFDEMGFIPTTLCPEPEEYAIEWRGKVWEEIELLKAENAALRDRLDKAEIPCHIGDTLYEPFCGTMIREWVVESIHVGLIGVTVNCHRKDDYKWHDSFAIRKLYNDFGEKGRVCLTREAAEARLAEMKGEK